MTRYSRRQPASALGLVAVIAGVLYMTYMAIILPHPIIILVGVMFLLVLISFSSMKVNVDQSELSLSYGIGLLRFDFLLADIASGRIVRNKWWYGWGIHLTPHGWLFNVAGLEAVELTMTSGKKYRIGTAEPEELAHVIRSHEAALALHSPKRLFGDNSLVANLS